MPFNDGGVNDVMVDEEAVCQTVWRCGESISNHSGESREIGVCDLLFRSSSIQVKDCLGCAIMACSVTWVAS